ncbi:MAG: asparagine synthase (glutamine-hydrolyzing) [Crocinitomicaceae bacterium]|jgi:asparagine synthase (glutamine-hydrolysing)
MCGITGFVDLRKQTTISTLQSMTDSLVHRGPDGGAIEFFQKDNYTIGLGHRRLAIIDVSNAANQPMNFEEYWITFNGEIYNFQEIKNDLIKLGHQFSTNSDTEVILHAYKEWGISFVDKLIGMFAIVIYDEINEQFLCLRDRAGVKPFFYYVKDNLFLYASELKAFHQHPNFEKRINIDALAAFFQYGNVPTPHCIFENTFKLKPGYSLTVSLKTKGEIQFSEEEYWSVYTSYNLPKLDLSFQEAKKKTEELLTSACEYRMVSDVPVGVFLSGGYDSTCVTALLQKNRTTPLKTYTIGVPDIGLNEASYAKETARILGTDHTEVMCTEKEVLEEIKKIAYYYDEPFADSSALPTTLVSRIARRDVTVALSADAGDEVFAGYNRYDYMLKYRAKLASIPSFVRTTLAGIMDIVPSESIPVLKNKYNFHNRYEKMKGVLRNPSEESIMLSLSQQFTFNQIKELFVSNVSELETYYQSKELSKASFSSLAYMQAIDYQTYLLDDILQKVDRATMTVSLEGREPFLDHRVIEWAATLPDSYKYHHGDKKYILKEIVHQYIPKEKMDRPKMGFAIPIATWLQKDLREYVEEYISEEKIKKHGLLHWEKVKEIKTKFFSGKKELDYKIWYLLMFQMWYEEWM